jgi:hypothetical protein
MGDRMAETPVTIRRANDGKYRVYEGNLLVTSGSLSNLLRNAVLAWGKWEEYNEGTYEKADRKVREFAGETEWAIACLKLL